MKSRLVAASLALLLLAVVHGCSSSDDKVIDLSGNWTFTFTGGYDDVPTPWKIIQVGTDMTISYDKTGVNMVFVGKCTPSAGTFVVTFAAENQTFTGQSTDGELINGTWTAGSKSGTFVGVRRP